MQVSKKTHTAREIELWVKYMMPVRNESIESMKLALLEWFKAMNEEGLCEEGELPVEQFLGLV